MKSIVLVCFMLVSVVALADSNKWENNNSRDVVEILKVKPSQKFSIKENFVTFVNNSLELRVNGVVSYAISIEGSNSYNKKFLRSSKNRLETVFRQARAQCPNSTIVVVGELTKWESSLFGGEYLLVVYPPSLQAVCE